MIAGNTPSRITKAFCVGQAKSGTASLYCLLAKNHRAAHEPERDGLLEMILREARGEVGQEVFTKYLIERDARLNLEFDIAWANQFIIGHLLRVFPDARFVVLVRDPFTWLQSIAGHLASRELPAGIHTFLDWWFKPDTYPHTRHDSALKDLGLYSIAALLSAWDRHVTTCTELIPDGQRLVIRTHELSASYDRLAEFLGVPAGDLDIRSGHVNRGLWAEKLDALVDRTYLNEKVSEVCGRNLSRYFPGIVDAAQAFDAWDRAVQST